MNYKLDGRNLFIFGVYPKVDYNQECIALSGVFNLPKRKGTTEYNWGNSIEPFVDKEDIEMEGRTLTLKACLRGQSSADYRSKLDSYKSACIACRKLWTEFGEFDVVVKDAIEIEEYPGCNMAIITTKFWQQNILLPELIVNPSGNSNELIDNFSLSRDFGIYIASRKADKSIAKRIEISTTLPYTRTQYREARDVTFNCSMIGNDLQSLYVKMMQFQTLCIRPGIRVLMLSGNENYNLYFKDGITVKARLNTLLTFDLKCRVIT